MRRRLLSPGRVRRSGGRNHFTKPRVEALESRWLLSGDAALAQAFGQLPMSFQPNEGQTDPQVSFMSQGSGYSLFLTPTESVLSLQTPTAPSADATQAAPDSVLSMHLVGANAAPQVVGQDQLPGTSNYFIGNDPSQWHTDIPNYGQVEERSVYPGVDLVYYGNQQQLEYNFTVAPGADPGVIRMAFTGAESAALDAQGNLVLQTAGGPVVEQAPVLYQEVDGARQSVSGHFVLEDNGQVGFAVGSYDPTQPLVIDPVLSYSTYLGGNTIDEGYAIAVDTSGNAYVTGYASSTNFPTTANALQSTNGGNYDVFVAKLNAAGSALVYSTYLGGSSYDFGQGIAVDTSGSAYVTGYTQSTNFPTANPLQATFGGSEDAFVAKLNAAGSALVYSTYLGGSGNDEGDGIAVDTSGDAYVTGFTTSSNFPTSNPLQSRNQAGTLGTAFVAKLNAAGSALVYSTYLGGSSNDQGDGIAVDASGNAYVTGFTNSTNFPTVNPLQATIGGAYVAFVSKLNAAGSALVYSTYLGGSVFGSFGQGIAVDTSGNAYVTGSSSATNFPTTANALQSANAGNADAFVAKLNAAGSALVYSTYLGGSSYDYGQGIAVDTLGNAYVTGYTLSTNFPTTANALQSTYAGAQNAFVAKLSPAGTALVYSTYLGGSGQTDGQGIAVDTSGNVYVTGYTQSTNFPTVNPLQATPGGSGAFNVFVTKFAPLQASTTTVTSAASPSAYGQSVTFTATVASNPPGSGTPTGTVQFQIDGTNFGSPVALVGGSATSSAISTLSVAAHTITAIYSGDSNFATSTGTLTQTVTKAPLTITANNASKTYGQTATFASTAFTTSGLVGGDTVSGVTETSTGTGTMAGAGTDPIVASAAVFSAGSSSNYTITYQSGTLTVNPAPLTVTADNATSTYGLPAFIINDDFTTSGLQNFDFVDSVTESSTGAAGTSPAGTYPILVSNAVFTTGSASNYTITYVNGTLTVNPAALTLIPEGVVKTYGQTASLSGGSSSFDEVGLYNGDTVGSITEISAGAAATAAAGTYSIVASNAVFTTGSGSNYTITYDSATLTVETALLFITANNATKTYGQAASLSGTAFTTSSLLNGDTVSSVTETSTGSPGTAAAGAYTIVPSAAVFSSGLSTNYSITYFSGTLTVNTAPLTITANNASKTYGQTAPSSSTAFTTSGLLNGDTVSSVTETSAGSGATAAVGNYSLTPSSSSFSSGVSTNYMITYISATLTVNAAALTITANNASKTYGQTASFAATAFTTSGLVGGDTVGSVTETSTGSAATAGAGTDSIVPSAATFSSGLVSNYTITYANGTLTVNAAALTITANNASKTYGQTASLPGTAFTTSGLVNGDTVSGVTETSTGTAATAAAGTDSIVPSAATFSSGLVSNYTITYANGTLTVNPAALTITANNASKTYGQTASFAATAFTTSGLVGGDTVGSVTETSTGSAATAGAGTDSIVPSAATFSSGLVSNYTITYANGTLTVNAAALTITANNASKTYGQTASLPGTAFTTSGLVSGDTVSGVTETSTGAATTAEVGTDPIVPSAATFSSGLVSNYTITYANGILTVNTAALTITANNASKTYGQTTSFAATAFTTSGLVGGDTVGSVTETSTGSAATAGAGTDSIVPSAATFSSGLVSNYTITYANGTLTVSTAALTITANNASKPYGQTATFAGTAFTTSGLVNGDTVSGVTETSTGTAATAAVGTDPIVPSAATFSSGLSGNYAITYANGTLAVNPAALTITANDASKTYGQTATLPGTGFTSSGLVNGDTVSSVTETSTGTAATAAAGTDPIVPGAATFSSGLVSNYTITYANGTLTVSTAALTITANNASKTYGQTATLPATAFTSSGLVNGDTVSSVTETSTGTAATAAVGTDPVVPSAATFSSGLVSNYTITYANGTLTVSTAALTITANNASKTYGQTASLASTGFTSSGLVNGDTVSGVTETSAGTAATAAVGTDSIVPNAATFSSGLVSNYTITYANGTLTVNPAALTITANDASKTYGQTATLPATAFTTSGLVNGDTVTGVTESSAGAVAAALVSGSPYSITPSTAVGTGLGNYTISYVNGALTVNTAALSITANNASKTFGQTASFAGTAFTTSGLVNGDTVGSVTETSTGSAATAAVGTYPIVPSAATFSAGESSNYTITYADGTLTVNSAGLMITVASTTDVSVYGQSVTFTVTVASNPPGSGTPSGTVQFQIDGTNFGTAVTLVGGAATGGATSALSAGSHSIQAVYSGDANFSPGTGTLTQTVNPAALSITASDASKTYGQTATFAGTAFTATGLVGSDTVTGVTETSTGAGALASVGTYAVVPGAATFTTGLSSDYTITYANGTLTVNPAALTITANDASKRYGETATFAATAFTTNGLVNGDTVSGVTETSTGSAATASVGTDSIVPGAATFSSGLGSNYTITYANGTLTVSPAALTITANDASKRYGETATFAATAFTTNGLVNGDTVSGVTETSTGSAATASVGTDSIVPGAATFSSGLGSNYTITYADGTLTVNPAALVITANDTSKTYGQTASFAAAAFTTTGLAGGDTIGGVTESSTGSGPTAAVGTDPIVPSGATFSSGLSSNYTITYQSGTLTISPATLTITANNATKTYGQTASFPSTAFTTIGLVDGDTIGGVTEMSTGTTATAAVGTDPILASAATFSSGLSGNYTITYANGTLTVNPAALTITANDASKTYGQTATLPATAFTTSGLVNGDTVTGVTESSAGAVATALVSGSPYSITPSTAVGTGLGNYTISYVNGALTVNTAALSITANNASKTFGQTASFAGTAFTTSGLVNGDTVGSVTETSTGSAATAAVGTYPIVPSAATFSAGESSNYTITYADGTLTVNSAGLMITVASTTDVSVYGQSVTFTVTVASNPPGSGTPSGTVQFQIDGTNFGTAVTLVGGAATGGATSALSAGSHSIQAVYSGDANFSPGTGTLTQTVNPAALSITASDASKTYGQTATFAGTAFTATGLVGSDTVTGVTETSTGAGALASVGTYAVVPGAATFTTGLSSDYTITYANGTLTVNPAALTITANDASKRYGETATFAATAFTTNGLVNGDTVSGVTETSTGSAATASVGTDSIVPGAATFLSGLGSNYTITYANGTLTVSPAAMTITATSVSKTYGRTVSFAATAFTTMGLVGGDMVGSVTEASTASAATAGVGTYPIVPSAAMFSSGLSGNYAITYVNGVLTVNPAALSITATSASKTYGQTASLPSTAFTATGLVGSDTVSGVTETSTGSGPTAEVATYPIVPSAATFSVGLSSNYAITYANGTLTVNPAMNSPSPTPLVTVAHVTLAKIKVGKSKAQVIDIQFSGPVSAATANNVDVYTLATVPQGKKHTTKAVVLRQAIYSAATETVMLIPKKQPLALSPSLILTVNGADLVDSLGRQIDGDDKGQPGSNYTATLSKTGAIAINSIGSGKGRHEPVTVQALDTLLQAGLRAGADRVKRGGFERHAKQ